MIDGQSPLYQVTLNWKKLFAPLPGKSKAKVNCKCCSDSGTFTVTEAGPKQGHFEICNFCTDREVVLFDRYLLVKRVGEGNFSAVFLARDVWATGDEDQVLALKIFHQQYSEIGQAEYDNLKRARREDRTGAFGALRLFHGFRHDRKHFVLVTESLLSTDLFEHSTSPTTQQINAGLMACPSWIPQFVQNLAMNLYLLHERMDRLHGDLKPENIMYSRPQRKFKLIDYGNAVSMADISFYFEDFQFGSLLYRAPEIMVGVPFGKAADIWALGALIFEASSKRPLCSDISSGTTSLLTELGELVGPMPDSFASGKHFLADGGLQLVSIFEEQGRDFWHKWRMSNILQVSGIKDVRFLDLLAGMLDPNPEWRVTVREVLGHPLLAHLMPFGPPPPPVPATNGVKVADKEDIPPTKANTVDAQIEVLLTNELTKVGATATKTTAKASSVSTTPKTPPAATTTSNRKRKR